MPVRIQRKRTKGWRMPEGVVYVGRNSKYGNPFTVDPNLRTAQQAVDLFRKSLTPNDREKIRRDLRGKDLACWCRLDAVCHGDVLLEIANAEGGAA